MCVGRWNEEAKEAPEYRRLEPAERRRGGWTMPFRTTEVVLVSRDGWIPSLERGPARRQHVNPGRRFVRAAIAGMGAHAFPRKDRKRLARVARRVFARSLRGGQPTEEDALVDRLVWDAARRSVQGGA